MDLASGPGFDQLDSLEGWVAIKENPFACNKIPPKLLFLISWNEVDKKIAVTCRLRNRVVSDTEEHHGRSGLFSFQELHSIHNLLCLIHPSLSPYLPEFPEEPRGLWAFVSTLETPENIDDICMHLQTVYFPIALETCKEELLMSTLYEEHSQEEYFENVSELRRQGYEHLITNAEEELKNILFTRDYTSSMLEMKDVYVQEDEAVFKLNIALAELYNYQIQPFLDLREVACLKVREAKREIQNPDYGDRVKKEYCQQLTEWQQHYEMALDTIQDVYMKYYSKTKSILQGMLNRLEQDKKRFGPTSFELVGLERMYRIKEDYILENIQFLNNKRRKFVQERDKVKETIASLDEKPNLKTELTRLENKVFEWQLKIYDLHLETFAEEEKLAKTQQEAITRDIKDLEDEPVFYDAVEDVEGLSSDEEMPSLMLTDPRLRNIKTKLKSIQMRRAKLRNKKLALQNKVQLKEDRKTEEVERFKQHHAIQKKRDLQKEELEKKQEFIDEERKRTIDRLKSFKVKYPTPATIKPPRYQPPSVQSNKSNLRTTIRKGQPVLKPGSSTITKTSDKQGKTGKTAGSIRDKRPVPKPRSVNNKDNVDGHNEDIPVTIYVSGGHKGELDNQPNIDSETVIPAAPPLPSDSSSVAPPSAPPVPDSATPPGIQSPAPAPPVLGLPTPPGVPPPPPPPPPISTALPTVIKIERSKASQEKLKQTDDTLGPPDLGAIQAGLKGLKPVSNRPASAQKPKVDVNPMDEICGLIKKGVKLRPRKMSPMRDPEEDFKKSPSTPSENHMKLLVESLNKINVFTRESSPESDSDDGEFDD